MQVSNFLKYSNSNRGSIFVCVQFFKFYKYRFKTTIGKVSYIKLLLTEHTQSHRT